MVIGGSVFIELSLIIGVAIAISFVLKILKQPLIIGYIIAGIIVSPYFLNLVKSTSSINAFSQIGVAILLFMVGLNLNPKVIKDVGKVALITGLGQIIFTSVIAFAIGKSLGLDTITSIYIALAISFSSTIIIMKLLSDKEDTETLYGKIAIGFLIVQDIVAIIILMVISSLSGATTDLGSLAIQKLAVGGGLLLGLLVISVFILPYMTKIIASSQELLLLFSAGWALLLASLFEISGFSIEIGALLAGVTLSMSPYRYEISAKMKPLRDFFLLIFFIVLGSQMNFENINTSIVPILLFSALILIGNPIIVATLMGRLGYTKRNGFLAGLTVSQISEFSFILIALGVKVGHIQPEILSMMAVIGLITMAGSTYMIMHGKKIYPSLSPYLSVLEKKGEKIDEGKYHHYNNQEIILFGYNRIGYSLLKAFNKMKKKFLVVDYNPETVLNLAKRGIDSRYGDISDLELLEELPLKTAKMFISTIPDLDTNKLIIEKIREVNKKSIIIVVSHQIDGALELYDLGATYVITPHFLGGVHTANLIEKHGLKFDNFKEEGKLNLKELLERKKEGHKDPLHERD